MGNCLPKKKKSRVDPMSAEEISKIISKGADIGHVNPNQPADMARALREDDATDDHLTPDVAKQLAVAFTVDIDDTSTPKSKSQMPKRLAERLAAEKAPKSEIRRPEEENGAESRDRRSSGSVKNSDDDDAPNDHLTPEVAKQLAVAFTVDLGDTSTLNSKPQMPKRLEERLAAEKAPKSEFDYTDEEEMMMTEIMREARLKEVKEKALQEEIKIYDAQRKRMVLEKSREAQLEKKKNRVDPMSAEEISKILSKCTDNGHVNSKEPANMASALKENDAPDDHLTPEATKQLAVAFTVDLGDTLTPKSKPKMPKRLAERLAAERAPTSEFDYTDKEELMMAEIMREARLKEVKEKALQEEIKIYDAQRKRMVLEKSREAQLEERIKNKNAKPVLVSEARQRVKELAEADRKKASERRNDSLQQ